MGRHTAPIPIVVGERPPTTRPVQVTDPALLDGRAASRPSGAPVRRGAHATSAVVPSDSAPAPAAPTPVDAEIDEVPVAVDRVTARAVLDAQAEDAAARERPVAVPRARELVLTGSAIAALVVAVGATFLR